jgi:hypothetical protein
MDKVSLSIRPVPTVTAPIVASATNPLASIVHQFVCQRSDLTPLPTASFFLTLPDGRSVRRSARLNPNDSLCEPPAFIDVCLVTNQEDTLSIRPVPTVTAPIVASATNPLASIVHQFVCQRSDLTPLPTASFFLTLPDGRSVRRSARLNPNDSPDSFLLTRLSDGRIVRRSTRIAQQRLRRNSSL